MSNDGKHYFFGKTLNEKHYFHEQYTLLLLQMLSSNGRRNEYFELLETIQHEDKQKDITQMCGMV